jgi:hypothetical protein
MLLLCFDGIILFILKSDETWRDVFHWKLILRPDVRRSLGFGRTVVRCPKLVFMRAYLFTLDGGEGKCCNVTHRRCFVLLRFMLSRFVLRRCVLRCSVFRRFVLCRFMLCCLVLRRFVLCRFLFYHFILCRFVLRRLLCLSLCCVALCCVALC